VLHWQFHALVELHVKRQQLLQPLKIPKWKWEEIGMDFIIRLPSTQAGYDSIWVIMKRLAKVAHFIPVKTTYSGATITELYMSRIVCLDGVPKKIMSVQGFQFMSKYWESFMKRWTPSSISAQHIIRRPTDKQSGPIRY
jgi:hypothetical protein